MEQSEKHTYRFRLDFLYQSIAVYAVTIVIYLIARGLFFKGDASIVLNDPILYLLSIITIASVFALLYNAILRRRVVIEGNKIHFLSAVRQRSITKDDVRVVRFGRERKRSGASRVVMLRLKDRKRPVRIRPYNFEHSSRLVNELREWAGPLAAEGSAQSREVSGT
jgi:hypothetical protein